MASMCSGLAAKAPSFLLLALPGAAMILLGVAILLEPRVLVWVVAAAALLLGVALVAMASVVYRFAARMRGAG